MMRAADPRPGALVGWRVTGWRMAENKGLSAPHTSHAFSSQILAHSQTLEHTPDLSG